MPISALIVDNEKNGKENLAGLIIFLTFETVCPYKINGITELAEQKSTIYLENYTS